MKPKPELKGFIGVKSVKELINNSRFEELYALYDIYRAETKNLYPSDLSNMLLSIGVDFCDNLTTIPDQCYRSLPIESINLVERVEVIGKGAFFECKSLKHVYLGRQLEEIKEYAFCDCEILNGIYYEGTIEDWNRVKLGKNWCLGSGVLFVECKDGKADV